MELNSASRLLRICYGFALNRKQVAWQRWQGNHWLKLAAKDPVPQPASRSPQRVRSPDQIQRKQLRSAGSSGSSEAQRDTIKISKLAFYVSFHGFIA